MIWKNLWWTYIVHTYGWNQMGHKDEIYTYGEDKTLSFEVFNNFTNFQDGL